VATSIELDAMRRAIARSALGLGTTSPNPPVGCVVLDPAGRIVGEGHHVRAGGPHAEAHALAAAGTAAAGGTAVVTLEPCNHHGRTPPCRQALLDARIARVVVALVDPTSREEGGIARLRKAGVDVEEGVLADEARLVLGPWLAAQERGRPHLSWAYRLDDHGLSPVGGPALDGLRRSYDAVIGPDGRVGEGVPGGHNPADVRLDRYERFDEFAGLAGPGALAGLYDAGVRTALLHGGAALAEPYLAADVLDEVIVDLALGAASARPPTPDLHSAGPVLVPPGFRLQATDRHGAVVRVRARRG
jgi:diaminohydroxyphosphoribosylaminopyrimidine deaminase/5-amino-6-(5-phosphoribosylamino)uracil reductase